MKQFFYIFLMIIFTFVIANGQSKQINYPANHIVVAAKANFYSSPRINSNVIGVLTKGEKVATIGFKIIDIQNFKFSDLWIKIRRNSDNKIGYVIGKSIKPVNQVYFEDSDCEIKQDGYWYGLKNKNNKTFINSFVPKIRTSFDFNKSIVSGDPKGQDNFSLFFSNDKKLKEGEITMGNLSQKHFKLGDYVSIFKSNNYEYFIEAKNGMYFFVRKDNKGKQTVTKTQDITGLLGNYLGVGSFRIDFVGDIDNDGIPEIVFSEVGGMYLITYYFKATLNSNFELQSLTFSSAKC